MNNKNGSGDKLLDWGVIIAALVLFPKTADILSYFAPQILTAILGFDVALIYGLVCASLVEGLTLEAKLKLSGYSQDEVEIALTTQS